MTPNVLRLLIAAAGLTLVSAPLAARQSSSYYDARPEYASASAASGAHYAWADVLRVDPVYESVPVTRTRRECRDVRVTRRNEGNGTAGTVIGAIVGGALGNTIGKGDGRQAATVVGAVAGGAIGHGVATSDEDEYSSVRTECENVPQMTHERRISSYDVEYRYQGDVYMSRLAYDPGERLRVRVSVTPVD